MRDIYTTKELTAQSYEHIINDFLGGSEVAPLINRDTNTTFGSTIDAALHNGLREMLLLFGVRNDSTGTTARPHRILPNNYPRRWLLHPEGRLEFDGIVRDLMSVAINERGELAVQVAVAGGRELTPERIAEDVVKKIVRAPDIPEKWKTPNVLARVKRQLISTGRERLRTDVQPVEWDLHVGFSLDALRSVVKMACNLFALHNRSAFCSPNFDAVRRFVYLGQGTAPLQLCHPSLLDAGAIRHGVGFDVRNDGMVSYAVTIFGQLSFCGCLGQVPDGTTLALRRRTYIVDQLGQMEWSDRNAEIPITRAMSLEESIGAYVSQQRQSLIRTIAAAEVCREFSGMAPHASDADAWNAAGRAAERVIWSFTRNGLLLGDRPEPIPHRADSHVDKTGSRG